MKLPAHSYLDQLGISYERRSFPPTTEKGAAAVARNQAEQRRLEEYRRLFYVAATRARDRLLDFHESWLAIGLDD